MENLQERLNAIENKLHINTSIDTSVWKSLSYNESCEENCKAEDESMKISEDVHSFLFTSNIFSLPFIFGILVVTVFQVLVLALIISHVFQVGLENPLQIPGNVEIQVRVSQIIALFISVFIQDDSREGMEQLLRGFPTMYKGNDNLKETMTPLKWYFGNTIRFFNGMLIIVTSFMLLVTVDTVLDVVLNFLGVQFVGSLDDLAFMLCKTGYFGTTLERKANDIATVEFKNDKKMDIWLQRFGYGYLAHHIHGFLISIILLVAIVTYYRIASKQSEGFWFDNDLLIEIGDETFPYIGLFSGCYKRMSDELIHGRAVYRQHGVKEGGVFAFCNRIDDKPGWTLNLWSFNDNPCEGFIIKSIETKTFDLADLRQEQWYTNENIPLDLLSISEVGNDASKTCAINMLDLAKGSCREIEAVGAWPQFFTTSTFEKLEHIDDLKKKIEESISNDYPSMTQIHPIFINKDAANFSSPKEIQLILFTGRRWVLVFAHNIKAFKRNCSDDTISKSEYAKDTIAKSEACVKVIKEYFKNGETFDLVAQTDSKTKWVLSVSEGVQLSSDPGSPVSKF